MAFDIQIEIKRGAAMHHYNIKAPAGLTALFGPSGAGKSTLLDAVAGLLKPKRGYIQVLETVLFDKTKGIHLKPEQRHCGYVFQDIRLFPHLNVDKNLRYGQKTASSTDWTDTLELLGIVHLLERMPTTLSGGEAQRVAIGRAILSNPAFLLMDEPLASVDQERREEILRLIERIRDAFCLPILYVSHDRQEVERLADTIIPISSPL